MPPRKKTPRSAALVAAFFLLTGCGGPSVVVVTARQAALPGPPPPAPRAASAPRPALPASASAAAPAPASAPAAAIPPPLAEPLPPLTRPIVSVTLPGVGPLVAVGGQSSQDIWFVAEDQDETAGIGGPKPRGTFVHYDGKRVVGRHKPMCLYYFYGVSVGKDEVLALGSNAWLRGVPGRFRASLSRRDGKWDCSSGGYSTGIAAASDAHVWTLDCDHLGGNCALGASHGPRAQLPSYDASFGDKGKGTPLAVDSLWMHGPSDGWMTSRDEDGRTSLLRYNGVTWLPQAALDVGLAVLGLWVDAEGHAWLTARRGGKEDDPANRVLRLDGHALESLPVPASFAAGSVCGTGPRDVWFVGAGRKVYQWDGQQLRQGEAPFEVGGAWCAPGGELWIVANEHLDNEQKRGVAAHTAPLSKAR